MGNNQKPSCSSYIAIDPHNFQILLFLLYGYHTPQLENIALPAIVFSLHTRTFMNLLIGIFWVSNLTKFSLKIDRNYVSILITIISNITVLVSHNVICFIFFMPISHYVNQTLLQHIVSIVV